MGIKIRVGVVLLGVLGWFIPFAGDARAAQRPFVIDDIFHMESLSDSYAFSADGALMTFVVTRAIDADIQHHALHANDRSDVWLHDRVTQTVTNLTKGETDSSAFWYPTWSPDGNRLAMISTRNSTAGRAHVWIWDRKSGELAQLGNAYTDIDNDRAIHERLGRILWVSDSVLVFPSMPEAVQPTELRTVRQSMRQLQEAWLRSMKGEQPTAVTFESGRIIPRDELVNGEKYVSCNVQTRRCADILRLSIGAFVYDSWGPVTVQSPTNRIIAAFDLEATALPNPNETMHRYNSNRYRVRLFDENSELAFSELASIKNAIPGSLRWSPDGRRVAFIGSMDQSADIVGAQRGDGIGPSDIYTHDLETGQLELSDLQGLRLIPETRWRFHARFKYFWANENGLVLHAQKNSAVDRDEGWWLLSGNDGPLNITAKLGFVPDELYPTADASSFLCAGKGNLWLVSSKEGPRQLTRHPESDVIAILWGNQQASRGKPVSELVYQIRSDASRAFYHFDLEKYEERKIRAPGKEAEFKNFLATDQITVFSEKDATGTRIWLSGGGLSTPRVIFETNTFLRNIAEGEVASFDYVSLEGEPLKAWLMLPANYERGKHYPMVTWVYQTAIQEKRPALSAISTLNPLNLQTLAANGYAVLFPSMPGKAHEYHRLLNGVMPAIDEAVGQGVADPERLAVMGQSNGGYTTYGLISLTSRFKAAVALAGTTDLTSIALQFAPSYQRREMTELGVTAGRFVMMESYMDFGMPWKGISYLINSPITYVERVHTPILQLHGDFDGVPVQQAEEFFTAMQRLGKRAKFIKYLGEGHVFQSPANVRHGWQQIIAWLDEFLRVEESAKNMAH